MLSSVLFTLALLIKLPGSPLLHPTSDVCSTIKHGRQWNGKLVSVRAPLIASVHGTALQASDCNALIFLNYDSNKQSSEWKSFYEAVFAYSSGSSSARIVTLEGIYRDSVPDGDRKIHQIEIRKIVDVADIP